MDWRRGIDRCIIIIIIRGWGQLHEAWCWGRGRFRDEVVKRRAGEG